MKATLQALETHELIKVKLADGERGERAEGAAALAAATGAALAQTLGRTALLYKALGALKPGESVLIYVHRVGSGAGAGANQYIVMERRRP